jgi:hypothetical protein
MQCLLSFNPSFSRWNVPFTVFRGNPSDTICYNVGKLLRGPVDEIDPEEPQTGSLDKEVVILHLRHHDAFGLNISRVAKKKIEKFARRRSIEWIRAALDTKQFDRMKDQFGIPVKRTDKLAPEYVSKHGNLCVEVDAIPSEEVRGLLETAITKRIDMEKWKQTEATEGGEQQQIERLVSRMRGR